MTDVHIREATINDASVIAEIYAVHVLNGTATFEEIPPTAAEIAVRMKELMANGLPWVVAEVEHNVIGYAYAALFHERSAYRYTVEDSIYLAETYYGRGVGSSLLQNLIARCSELEFRHMMAIIGDSNNTGSIALHKKFGFQMIGTAKSIGFKFDREIDVVYMQKILGN